MRSTELDLDIAAKLALVPRHRLAGTLPVALPLALLRPRPDRLAWVGDVVLHAVARGEPNTVLPHLDGPQPIGALAEGVPDPGEALTDGRGGVAGAAMMERH